jgi:5-methylcytosine-specific restriction endonuclease McrA
MRRLGLLVFVALLAIMPALSGRSSSHSAKGSRAPSNSAPKARSTSRPSKAKCASCARDSKGKIKRSATAKRDFQKAHPCPSTGRTFGACKGYVIDHVVPLKRGSPDSPSNMQWQTTAAAKAKDRIE